jgi:hypothetical protein
MQKNHNPKVIAVYSPELESYLISQECEQHGSQAMEVAADEKSLRRFFEEGSLGVAIGAIPFELYDRVTRAVVNAGGPAVEIGLKFLQ